MALTEALILELLTSKPQGIVIHTDGRFEIEGASDTAGALFDKNIEMIDYSYLEADLEDDHGYYRETTFYERQPDESEDNDRRGFLITGIYKRNTDIYGSLAIEATFEGRLVETSSENHEQLREIVVAQFLDQTITERLEIVERELGHLTSNVKSRSRYTGAEQALDSVRLKKLADLNRAAAMILSRQTP